MQIIDHGEYSTFIFDNGVSFNQWNISEEEILKTINEMKIEEPTQSDTLSV